ncbi:EfeM/EfeO family lipoprotein [Actinacidiphila sp. bgisy145]|uniref:EfeM/EfeO family lipoprotein n=1 Tax=Actinacidiphila sp. bgisy145 TaxID=3413792 RepID=UPI003EB779A8
MPAEPAPEPAPAAGEKTAAPPDGVVPPAEEAAEVERTPGDEPAAPDGKPAPADTTAATADTTGTTGTADTDTGADTDLTASAAPSPDTPATAAATGAPRRRRARGWTVAATAVAVAAAVTAGVLATGGGHRTAGTKAAASADGLEHTAVEVSPSTCGRGWGAAQQPHAGTQAFDLHNTAGSATEVYLKDPKTGKLFAEIEGLAPGATRSMVVDLGSGRYAFECQQEDTDAVTGPTVTVPGTVPQGPSSLPVTVHDLIPPTLAYQKWIKARMAELATDTGVLKSDIDRGDLAAARRDWLTGHLVYERMGAAYDTFGDADGVINGTAPIGQDPSADPDFTGFHRIEYGLWHGASAKSLRGQADTLDKAVRALKAQWSTQQMDPANMGLRAHEIIENAEQFELTARTDYGSGTNLATASANIDGTRAILAKLRPLLAARDTGLKQLDASLDRAQNYLKSLEHGGNWTPLAELTRAQREQVNADFGDLLEQLAPVAAIFDVRRTV